MLLKVLYQLDSLLSGHCFNIITFLFFNPDNYFAHTVFNVPAYYDNNIIGDWTTSLNMSSQDFSIQEDEDRLKYKCV